MYTELVDIVKNNCKGITKFLKTIPKGIDPKIDMMASMDKGKYVRVSQCWEKEYRDLPQAERMRRNRVEKHKDFVWRMHKFYFPYLERMAKREQRQNEKDLKRVEKDLKRQEREQLQKEIYQRKLERQNEKDLKRLEKERKRQEREIHQKEIYQRKLQREDLQRRKESNRLIREMFIEKDKKKRYWV